MSRGLGRVERFVLAWLAKSGRDETIWGLVHGAAGSEPCPQCDADFRAPKPTPAQYSAVCRAVASLERKGAVTTEVKRSNYAERGTDRYKVVRLSVDQLEMLPVGQRLRCRWDEDHEREARRRAS